MSASVKGVEDAVRVDFFGAAQSRVQSLDRRLDPGTGHHTQLPERAGPPERLSSPTDKL